MDECSSTQGKNTLDSITHMNIGQWFWPLKKLLIF